MKGYKSVMRFSWVSLKESFHSAGFYLVLIVIFLVIQFLCSGIGAYLHDTYDSMNIFEIYIWFMSRRNSQVIYLLGVMALIFGASFFHSGSAYFLLRTNRRTWIFSQMGYLFMIVTGFNLFILVSFIISCRGAVTFCGRWSEAALTACQTWVEDIGICSFISADAGFLVHNPNAVGIITLCLQILIGVITGMILLAFQARGKMVWGVMFVSILWFLEVTFELIVWEPLAYMTPFRLSRPAQLSLNGFGPPVIYAFAYLLLLCLVLESILLKLSKSIDFVKME